MEDALFAGTEHGAAATDAQQQPAPVPEQHDDNEFPAFETMQPVEDDDDDEEDEDEDDDYDELHGGTTTDLEHAVYMERVHEAVFDLEDAGYSEGDILLVYGEIAARARQEAEAAVAAASGAPPIDDYDDLPWYANGGFGAVPASTAAVAGLEKRAFVAHAAAGATACGICLEDFVDGEEVSAMPCAPAPSRGHEFHAGCIAKWLGQYSNTCPLCRHALPKTNDEDVQLGLPTAASL